MKIKDLEALTLKHQSSIKDVTTTVQHIDMSNKQLKGDNDAVDDDDDDDDDDKEYRSIVQPHHYITSIRLV